MREETEPAFPAKDSRTSKLPLAVQDKIIAELTEAVYVLMDRLEPVLTPLGEDESMKSGVDKKLAPQSPLATTLDMHNASLQNITKKLNSILDRLEC